jgi:Zn-dependent peptidase ImmA (M78 family)/transcriptional regulator with XRE-family HTH domain
MLVLAREARGLTQRELASRLEMDAARLSRIECGLREFPDEYIAPLTRALEFPEEFFSQNESRQGMAPSEIYHRKRAALGARDLARIHARIDLYRIAISRLLRNVETETVKAFPRLDLEEHDSPDEVARLVRAAWGTPAGPIPQLIPLIENAGGFVIFMDFGTRLVDAVSRWLPGLPPMIFVNHGLPPDRKRFTIAHELGHLIMHSLPRPEMEDEANQFASEFLTPSEAIRNDLRDIDLPRLAILKSIWKVSMAALLKRAHQLGTVSDRYYRYMWTRMAPYRMREPIETDFPEEQPVLLGQLVGMYRSEMGFSTAEVGRFTRLPVRDVVQMFFPEEQSLRLVK